MRTFGLGLVILARTRTRTRFKIFTSSQCLNYKVVIHLSQRSATCGSFISLLYYFFILNLIFFHSLGQFFPICFYFTPHWIDEANFLPFVLNRNGYEKNLKHVQKQCIKVITGFYLAIEGKKGRL